MVQAKHSVPGRPTKLVNSGGPEGPSALGVGAGGFVFFSRLSIFSPVSLSLEELLLVGTQYRLKCCLKRS